MVIMLPASCSIAALHRSHLSANETWVSDETGHRADCLRRIRNERHHEISRSQRTVTVFSPLVVGITVGPLALAEESAGHNV